MIFPYLLSGTLEADAASNYDHNALSEYKGYGEAMYETIVDQTTFVSGQYTENKQYVKDSMGQIRDYADFWLEEKGNLQDACSGTQIFTKNCFGELTSSAGGYALTVGDWIKNMFTDAEEEISVPDYSVYDSFLSMCGSYTLCTNPGITAEFYKNGVLIGSMVSGKTYHVTMYYDHYQSDPDIEIDFFGKHVAGKYIDSANWNKVYVMRATVSGSVELFSRAGLSLKIKQEDKYMDVGKHEFSRINDFIHGGGLDDKQLQLPKLKPSLTCPSGEVINLAVDGSTFLNKDGTVMLVNKDGTATVNGTSCALQWQTPQMGYVDDKAAMTDPEGNWIDVLTGEVLECIVEGGCVPVIPDDKEDDKEDVEELDNGLIEYVKNAYEYATGVLKTATDGLASLATGAKDLTALFGTFFSWLPKEMVVLMSSGLGIAIGLRLFRK